ncbi:MAG TPA: hypothetical protein VD761_11915 [Solirubrobacterales bacterium]|nr:hypothetical protein [Solirubrobacterales bacterium]
MALRPSQVETLRVVERYKNATRVEVAFATHCSNGAAGWRLFELARDGFLDARFEPRLLRSVYRLTQLGKEALESSEVQG